MTTGEAKKNCWEYQDCGRELGGKRAYELGVCPASTYIWLDGFHGGRNAGRACWIVAGTMCNGEVRGTFAEKHKSCGKCEFYNMVKAEEGEGMTPTVVLLKQMEEHKE